MVLPEQPQAGSSTEQDLALQLFRVPGKDP